MLCSVLIGGLHLNPGLLYGGCRCLSVCGDLGEGAGAGENEVGVIKVLGLVVFAMVRVS